MHNATALIFQVHVFLYLHYREAKPRPPHNINRDLTKPTLLPTAPTVYSKQPLWAGDRRTSHGGPTHFVALLSFNYFF